MNREEIEYYYYYGVLEQNVAYKKDDRISMEELKKSILNEELDKYCNIEFNPSILTITYMIALIEKENSFSILSTGEKGAGVEVEFQDIGLALNYMLAQLRLRKKCVIEQSNSDKKEDNKRKKKY